MSAPSLRRGEHCGLQMGKKSQNFYNSFYGVKTLFQRRPRPFRVSHITCHIDRSIASETGITFARLFYEPIESANHDGSQNLCVVVF